ncbi:unnamed protein product [Cyprideis torosa]|uniref:Ribosome biogenesis regulatory protein n=1 Tax=Cyprideis torosa TaxID=163714 RepID=A0A7R8ZRE9_9CRUS|nr:unnamed protein product [Cyprideis torosa]CAG0903559.1 unnamed protein product [Cyprideis torosa]
MASVDEILQRSAALQKSTEVHRDIELDLDCGHLVAFDDNLLSATDLKERREPYLREVARDNAQLMINRIWTLDVSRVDGVIVAKLPSPTIKLPRSKPAPKKRPLTKWEKFAKEKGIQKRKKSKLMWDEELKKWVPRFGYRRNAAQKQKEWVLEVPEGAPDTEDMFARRSEEKRERMAKNEYQRLKNVARTLKVMPTSSSTNADEASVGKVGRKKKKPQVGIVPMADLVAESRRDPSELKKEIVVARQATASVGTFTTKLPKEKVSIAKGKKQRHRQLFGNPKKEEEANLAILERVLSKKKPELEIDKAVNQEISQEQRLRAIEKSEAPAVGKKRRTAAGRGGTKREKKKKWAEQGGGAMKGGRVVKRSGKKGAAGGGGARRGKKGRR